MRHTLPMLILVAFAALLPACATNTTNDPEPITDFSPVGNWTLTQIEGERYDLPQGARTPTLTIDPNGSIAGYAGINRFSGKTNPQAWNENNWDAGGIVMTRMGGDTDAMAFEQRYISMLQRADTITPGTRSMDLKAGNTKLLRFVRSGQ